jgi:hypothetical protein
MLYGFVIIRLDRQIHLINVTNNPIAGFPHADISEAFPGTVLGPDRDRTARGPADWSHGASGSRFVPSLIPAERSVNG